MQSSDYLHNYIIMSACLDCDQLGIRIFVFHDVFYFNETYSLYVGENMSEEVFDGFS